MKRVRRGGWLLPVLVLGVAAWLVLHPGEPVRPLTPAELAGCYAGSGARIVLRADGSMRAGSVEARYHIIPGVRGSRPDTLAPEGVEAAMAGDRLVFSRSDAPGRWYPVAGTRLSLYAGNALRHLPKLPCEGVTS
ncbi:hypothetical protein [Sphingomonas sp.]|uniref:hypothetical protein n=1 Tax=Sphingomonas sp. TaxID=28214 RepID=UPI001EC39E42|nr:hypothetical protein [Sphingomonas sp.]MBX3595451.1 hypothetical protein [Sphingomonas sp.]